jgi:hypothetical protein
MPSSVIRSSRYKPDEKRLDVVFVSGRRYSYREVPADVAQEFRTAFSKGEFFNAHIRDHFPFSREGPRGARR